MNPIRFLTPADLHGLARLAGDGVSGTSRLAEELHLTISSARAPLGAPVEGRTRGITGLVYGSVRAVNALVGVSVDAVASGLIGRAAEVESTAAREHWLAAVNGILGDHLAASGNPLAIPMRFRHQGRALSLEREGLSETFDAPANRLLIAVHGLCMNELHWGRAKATPQRLGRALGFTPLHLHYNSGRAIADNGAELAAMLEHLVKAWPVPVSEIVIVGHSMGGLVARSALEQGRVDARAWTGLLSRMVFLGTPHHGAPLERLGHRFESVLRSSPYLAPFTRLGAVRSAGIVDLRHGGLPRPGGDVELFAVAATARSPVGGLLGGIPGDGLVPVDSALGDHPDSGRSLAISQANRLVVPGAGHVGLLEHPRVYRQLRRWLGRGALSEPGASRSVAPPGR